MRWLFFAGGGAAVLVVIVVLIGYALPIAHTATRRVHLGAAPAVVYGLLADVDRYPTWRPGVRRLRRLPDRDGRAAWVEESRNGTIPFVFDRAEPTSHLVARIDARNLAFGGTWTYAIDPAAGGSDLTITENGEVYNPFFRFMSRFVFGYYGTLDEFVGNLQAKLGDRLHQE